MRKENEAHFTPFPSGWEMYREPEKQLTRPFHCIEEHYKKNKEF